MSFGFENLIIWQKSRCLVKEVYILAEKFPREERYGLSDQIRRAIISVSSNIAEGAGRYSLREKIHFCEIAYGSLMEVVCQLTLACDLNFILHEEMLLVRDKIEDLSRAISGYRKALQNQLQNQSNK